MIYAVMAVRMLEGGARFEQVDQAAKELKLLPPFISFDSWKPSIVEDVTHIMRALRTSMIVAAARVTELGESLAAVDLVATDGIKMAQAALEEIGRIGAAAVLDELAQTNRVLGGKPLAAPELLMAMAQQKQTFYKNQQANPWLRSRKR